MYWKPLRLWFTLPSSFKTISCGKKITFEFSWISEFVHFLVLGSGFVFKFSLPDYLESATSDVSCLSHQSAPPFLSSDDIRLDILRHFKEKTTWCRFHLRALCVCARVASVDRTLWREKILQLRRALESPTKVRCSQECWSSPSTEIIPTVGLWSLKLISLSWSGKVFLILIWQLIISCVDHRFWWQFLTLPCLKIVNLFVFCQQFVRQCANLSAIKAMKFGKRFRSHLLHNLILVCLLGQLTHAFLDFYISAEENRKIIGQFFL